jgi:hypothetical protein
MITQHRQYVCLTSLRIHILAFKKKETGINVVASTRYREWRDTRPFSQVQVTSVGCARRVLEALTSS